MLRFADRREAGRLLASKLKAYKDDSGVVVVALPSGGVPVGAQIAQQLGVPLDVLVVRKIGVPWQPELAMGAVASGGVRILNRALIRPLNLSDYFLYSLVAKEEQVIERRETHIATVPPHKFFPAERSFWSTMVQRRAPRCLPLPRPSGDDIRRRS
jgi:putative phosphoribosyl transferase